MTNANQRKRTWTSSARRGVARVGTRDLRLSCRLRCADHAAGVEAQGALGSSMHGEKDESALDVRAERAVGDQNETEEPQPQEPLVFGLLNLNPAPWSPST